VKEEVADDLGIAAHEEGERGGHEVPNEDLVIVEHLHALRVLCHHRPHGLTVVADDRPPQQPPRLPLCLCLLPQGDDRRHCLICLSRCRVFLLLGGRGLKREQVWKEVAVEEREVAGNGITRVGGDEDWYRGGRSARAGLRLRHHEDEEGEAPTVRGWCGWGNLQAGIHRSSYLISSQWK
jgi:hypothetical protein